MIQIKIWKGLFFENEVQPPNYIIVDPELTEPAQIIFLIIMEIIPFMLYKKHYLLYDFNCFSLLATETATAASPVTFTVVLIMSKILSTPRIRATPALGTPTAVSYTHLRAHET